MLTPNPTLVAKARRQRRFLPYWWGLQRVIHIPLIGPPLVVMIISPLIVCGFLFTMPNPSASKPVQGRVESFDGTRAIARNLSYSYRVDGVRYSGEAHWASAPRREGWRAGDPIGLVYDADRPWVSASDADPNVWELILFSISGSVLMVALLVKFGRSGPGKAFPYGEDLKHWFALTAEMAARRRVVPFALDVGALGGHSRFHAWWDLDSPVDAWGEWMGRKELLHKDVRDLLDEWRAKHGTDFEVDQMLLDLSSAALEMGGFSATVPKVPPVDAGPIQLWRDDLYPPVDFLARLALPADDPDALRAIDLDLRKIDRRSVLLNAEYDFQAQMRAFGERRIYRHGATRGTLSARQRRKYARERAKLPNPALQPQKCFVAESLGWQREELVLEHDEAVRYGHLLLFMLRECPWAPGPIEKRITLKPGGSEATVDVRVHYRQRVGLRIERA